MAKNNEESKARQGGKKSGINRKELKEKVECLVELHKLQGVLLSDVKKQIKI